MKEVKNMELIIYKDYRIIEELEKLINNTNGSWEEEGRRYRYAIKTMIVSLKKSVELIIENDN